MIARYHHGDENGYSNAKFAALALSDEAIKAGYTDIWLEHADTVISLQESGKKYGNGKSTFHCQNAPAHVIIRRKHDGDENGITTYFTAKVIAEKRRPDGSTELHNCIFEKEIKIKSDKESKAGWVESTGKIIIGRDHGGDENGYTYTYFAELNIRDANGCNYPVLLTSIKELGEKKEWHADFYVDKPEFSRKFRVWCSPAFFDGDPIDHTWVDSLDENEVRLDKFSCHGGTDEVYSHSEYSVDMNAQNIKNYCRSENDAIGISCYGVWGVCHQMANRFLYPFGVIKQDYINKPIGYGASCAAYGEMGLQLNEWLQNDYLRACHAVESMSAEMPMYQSNTYIYDETKEIYYLIESTLEFYKRIISDFNEVGVANAQRKWMRTRASILVRYGILCDGKIDLQKINLSETQLREMVNDLNRAINVLQREIKEVLGDENYAKVNGNLDTDKNIINVDLSLSSHKH